MSLYDKIKKIFSFLFIPHYDELSLFVMGYICILILAVNANITVSTFKDFSFSGPGTSFFIVLFLPLLFGMLLCLYHAFTNRKKTRIEKKIMLLFAAVINGFSGIWGGTYILTHTKGFIAVFPIWNIISGFILLNFLKEDRFSDSYIEDDCISDENVSPSEIIVGAVIITVIFYVCYCMFDLNWAATFSICIAWATSMNRTFNSMLHKLRMTQI